MTLARLMNLPYRLSAEQKAWLKGLQKDKCPEIAEAAQMVYAEHFPYAERNERKKQLHISEMTFVVQDELWDEYGDSFDAQIVPFPVSWTVKMKKKQKETQDILSYHSQAAGWSDKARAKASGGRQPIEECGRTGL